MFRTSITISLIILVVVSCENSSGEIRRITHFEKAPDEYTENLQMVHSDSGVTKVDLYAELAETYYKPEHVTNFKGFLSVDFFNNSGVKISRLTSLIGNFNHDQGIVEVQDSVRLINFSKQQVLETEYLIWNKEDSTIRTDRNVIVRSPKEIIKGKGLITKQDFSFFEILEPTGKMTLNKE